MAPEVIFGPLADDSVAPAIFGLVRGGAAARPGLAESIRGSILLRFEEDYPAVRIDFRGDEIEVGDEIAGDDRAVDLLVSGRMGDINALIAAPLSAGLPRPTSARGRQALARLADGRVDFDGPLRLGRTLIMLLTLEDALPKRRASRRASPSDSRPDR
ncbi:MAG TPA: hypothetical protein VFZ89_15520 [Solirubrobacteraceae bacterium]